MPVVEAMAMDVPVLAYADTAVPETLGCEPGASPSGPRTWSWRPNCSAASWTTMDFEPAAPEEQRRRVRDFAPDCIEPVIQEILETVTA